MNSQVVEFIRWSSHLSVLIPLAVYLRRSGKFPIQNHIVGGLIILSGVTDTVSIYTGSALLFNIYEVLGFLLTTWFFYELVYKKKSELVALIAIGVYSAVFIFSIWKDGFDDNFSGLWATGAVITMINATVYVFNVPRMVIDRYFDNNLLSNMIFSASMFAYFFVAMIIFFLFDPVSKVQDATALKAFWSINNAFNIVKNLGFALAFYYTGKRGIYMTVEQLERLAKQVEKEKDLA